MAEYTLPVPPRHDNPQEWAIWFDKIYRILSGNTGIPWAIVLKAGSKLVDIETRLHANLQSIAVLDPTSTNATQDKHLSNAQAKVWRDHVIITDANPHGTDHSQLDNVLEIDTTEITPDTTRDKHVSNDDATNWQDHIEDTTIHFTQIPTFGDSTATDVAGIVADFNSLVGQLKLAGIIAT